MLIIFNDSFSIVDFDTFVNENMNDKRSGLMLTPHTREDIKIINDAPALEKPKKLEKKKKKLKK